VGGDDFQLTISSGNVGGVAWFPLGPREVYRPSYPVSRGYFENVNQSNTVINTTVINAARKGLKPAATAPAPVVKVIAPTQEASRTMRALPLPPTARPADARGKPDERKASEAIAVPAAPTQAEAPLRATPPARSREVAQSKATPAPQVAAPAPPERQQAQRAKPESAAAALQAERHSGAAAPESPPGQTQPATKAEQHGQESKPVPAKQVVLLRRGGKS